MMYGLYLSAQGANAQSLRLDVIANNLANGSTTAFKRDLAIFQAHHPFDVEHGIQRDVPGNLNEATGGLSLAEVVTDFRDGSLVPTGGTYDLALTGPGFFRISTGQGQQNFLTRNGRFTVNSSGELVMHDTGYRVLDRDGGPIRVPENAENILVSRDGTLHAMAPGGAAAAFGQLDVVTPRSFEGLVKVGESLYTPTEPPLPAGGDVAVQQGFLEESGTRPVLEMLDMIEASRGFETNVSMIRSQDEALGRLLQSMQR